MSKKKKPKPKKVKLYEVGIPVREIWVMQIWATSKKDAWERVREDGWQICSHAGTRRYIEEIDESDQCVN